MATLTNVGVMDAIEARLTPLGLAIAEAIADDMALPAAIVQFVKRHRTTFADGQYNADFRVKVIVAKGVSRVGYRLLASFDDVNGAGSIALALEPNLNGAVDSCEVTDYDEQDDDAARYGFLAGVFTLNVIGKGA